MADEQIVTNIVAKSDFSNLITDLNKVSSALTVLQDKLIASNKMLAAQVSVMNRSFAETLRSTGQFSTHFVSLSSDVDKFGSQLDKGQLKLNQFFKTYSNHIKSNGGLIRDLARQQVQMQNAVLQPLGRNAEGLMQYNVHIPRGLDLVKNKTAIAKQELMIMNKVIQEGAGQLINWGKNTQWAGRQLTVGLTLPLAAFGKASSDAFKQADEQLVRLTKVYGGVAATSSQELGKVRADVAKTAAELSKSYGSSFTDTIALAADIAATGKTGNELLGSIKETTRLAVLGEVDRQDAMKATLAIQTAFKQNTEELGKSINFLNAVENQTSTTLNDLVEAIPKAGPIIKGLGGNVQDLALYLTAMREGGISAAEGANALKSGLASLINPTKVATSMFAGFGINLKSIVETNAGNTTATILELQAALDKLDPLQKQRALEQLFGKFQFARMNALFENLGRQGSQTLQVMDLMKASSQDLANIAGRELSQVTESASGKYKRAIEGLKADLAGIGDQFLKINTTLINVVDKVIKFAQGLPGPVKTVLSFVGMLTAAAGPLIMLTGVLGNFFGYIIKGVSNMRAFFKGGEGWKLLTPEILAADKAGNLIEKTFYSDAKAAAILKQAIAGLTAEFSRLEATANEASIAVNPTVATTAGSTIIAGAATRVTNPNHPLVGEVGTRAAAHHNPRSGMSERERLNQTIHAFTPAPIPLNQKIGATPQIFSEGDLPKIAGLTAAGGASTGIVAGEAAKWHALMGTLSMMTKQEVADLKKEIARTGTFSAEINSTFGQLLPAMTTLTSNAASQSAAIVAELQAGKLTVDAAKAKIIALNAELEIAMGNATTQLATSLGRTVNLTQVPLIDQPIVSKSGKSNIKELFRKNRPATGILNKIANALGVKTWGGGYSTETTIPKRFNTGNIVPGNGNTDTVPAMLTPGEFVVNKKSTAANLPLLHAINNGEGSNGPNYNIGGQIKLERSHVAEGSAADLNKVRSKKGYGNTVSVSKGIPIWMTQAANQATRSVGKGMTGPQLAKEFRKAIAAGHHPFEPWMTASDDLGGDPKNKIQLNKVFSEMINKLEKDNRLFGGKNGEMTFEKWFQKEVISSKLFSSIKIGSRSFKSIFNSVLQPMGPRDGKPFAALETLVNDRAGLNTIEKSKLSGLAKGLLGTFSGKSYNSSRQALAKLMAKAFLKRNSGGMIPGYNLGGVVGNVLKGTAFRNVGAKFGKIGNTWGATSMSLGMGKKLFGSSGLTPKAQNLMYGKLIENLEKEMPYGYVKDAQGNLKNALEPNIVDGLLKFSAGQVLNSGGKSLSKIDREILKTKFANWDSKTWTPATSKVTKQMFGMNKGGLVPGYSTGGLATKYGALRSTIRGSKTIRSPKLDESGNPMPIDTNSGMASSMAGVGLMMGGSMVPGVAGQGMQIAGMAMQMSPLLPILTKITKGMGSFSGILLKVRTVATATFTALRIGLSAILGPVGLVSIAIGATIAVFLKLKKEATEAGKANRLAFGGTTSSFASVGINNYKSLTDRLKEVNQQMELNKAKAQSLYDQYTKGGPTGITLTIKELNDAISNAKKNQKEYVEGFNNIKSDRVVKYAADLKAQFISLGMSAKDASNQIYAIIKASDKSGQALQAVSSADFTKLQDQVTAISYLFDNLSKSTGKTFNAEEFTRGLDTLTNSILSYRDSLLAATDKKTGQNINDEATALKLTMDQIIKIKSSNTQLDKEQITAIKQQNLAYNGLLTSAETLQSVTAKILMYTSGLGQIVDFSKMSAQAAVDMANNYSIVESGMKSIFENTSAGKAMAAAIKAGQNASATLAANIKKAQNMDENYYDNKIKLIDKAIKKIQEEADARIKALQKQAGIENTALNIQKKQLEYQDKLASGDMAGAAQAQIDLQLLLKEKQANDAIAAIEEKRNADIDAKNKEKEKIQADKDAFAKGLQISQTKSAETVANVAQLQSFESRITSFMTQIGAAKDTKTKDDLTKQLGALLDEIRTSGNKEAVKFYQSLASQFGIGDSRYSDTKSPLNIAKNYASSFAQDASKFASNPENITFKTAVEKFAAAVNKFSNNEPIDKFRMAKDGEYNKKFGNYDTSYMTFIGPSGDKQTKLITSKQYKSIFDAMTRNGYNFLGYSKTNNDGAAIGAEDMGDKGFKVKKATGGYISGPGTMTSDSIPAMLSNGEYVINAASVKAIGTPTLDKINKMATGGFVSYNVPKANSYPMGYNKGGMVQHYNVGGLVINTQPGQNEMEIARMAVSLMDARNRVSSISQGRNINA
jgi:TP901 family phage tail tape measure protein